MMNSNIVTVAGVILDLAVAILLVRLAREISMREQRERNWLAFSEWLVVASALMMLAVMLIAVLGATQSSLARFQRAASVSAIVLLVGYAPSILAHYRFIGGTRRSGPRENPEPLEAMVVIFTAIAAFGAGVVTFLFKS